VALFHKALIGEEPGQQLLYAVSPISAAEACDSFRVVIGVLVASLTSLLLARPQFVRTACSRQEHVPNSFHFLMMDLTEFQGVFSALDIFLYPSPELYFSITFSLSCSECSLVFMV